MTQSAAALDIEPSTFARTTVGLLGFWSAVLTALFAAVFFLIGIFGTPYTAIGQYPFIPATINLIDYLWLYPAFLLAPTICILMICIHRYAPTEKKVFSQVGLSFALTYAVLITALYFTQWTVVLPALSSGQTQGLSLFTQYNPHGFFVALESLGYLLLNTALFAIVPIFSDGRRVEAALRWLFVVSFVAVVGSFVGLSLLHYDIVVFEVTVIAIDCILLIASATLLSILFKRTPNITLARQLNS
jgi:hypothetical protein